jgi:hypothetical protein
MADKIKSETPRASLNTVTQSSQPKQPPLLEGFREYRSINSDFSDSKIGKVSTWIIGITIIVVCVLMTILAIVFAPIAFQARMGKQILILIGVSVFTIGVIVKHVLDNRKFKRELSELDKTLEGKAQKN